MADTEYWALLYDGDDISRMQTVVRRRTTDAGEAVAELLRVDGLWHPTGIVALASLNLLEKELRPISPEIALDFERRVLSRNVHDEADA